jgi:hypothetical protein
LSHDSEFQSIEGNKIWLFAVYYALIDVYEVCLSKTSAAPP